MKKSFVSVLSLAMAMAMLAGCSQRRSVGELKNFQEILPYKRPIVNEYFYYIPPIVPIEEESKSSKTESYESTEVENEAQKKVYVKVNEEERVMPYEEEGKMVYTSIETGKPVTTSYKLKLN